MKMYEEPATLPWLSHWPVELAHCVLSHLTIADTLTVRLVDTKSCEIVNSFQPLRNSHKAYTMVVSDYKTAKEYVKRKVAVTNLGLPPHRAVADIRTELPAHFKAILGQLQDVPLVSVRIFGDMRACAGHAIGLLRMLDNLASLELFETGLYGEQFSVPYVFDLISKRHNALTRLGINDSHIVSIPESIGSLKALEVLDFAHCTTLHKLPIQLGACSNLQHIDLCNTAIEELPDSIGDLYQLASLDITCCGSLRKLPNSISRLQSLTELNASGCPGVAHSLSTIVGLTQLRHLDIARCNIRTIPDSFTRLQHLHTLQIGGNPLLEFPTCITCIRGLHILALNDCNLSYIPESFANLNQIRALDLSFNWLLELPPVLAQLTEIHSLYIADCGLVALPDYVASFDNLSTIDVSMNNITALQKEMHSLRHLKYFFHLGNGLIFNPVSRQYTHALQSWVECLPHIRASPPLPFPGVVSLH